MLRYHGRPLVFVLVLIKASLCFAAYDDPKGFRTAGDLLNQGSYLEALAAYNEIVTHSDIYESRAKGIFFMGNILIKDYPTSNFAQDALFNTGMVHYEKGTFGQAYQSFKSYLEKYPDGRHRQSAEVWVESAKAEMGAEKEKEPAPLPELSVADTTLRVLIRDKATSVTLSAGGPITISNTFSGEAVYEGLGSLTLAARSGRLVVNGRELKVSECIATANEGILALDGKRYRGSFRVSADDASKAQVINHVDLEAYLYGVVPREMSPKWAEDALKAQAVAARSYALYIKQKSTDKPYDLVATIASQVYGGYDAENAASTLAVDATRGEVITYDGRLTIAYFHANSGGFTESAKNVWVADLPYLRGTRDQYSDNIQNGKWDLALSYLTIQERLNQYGLNVGAISQIRPIDISSSGRPLKVAVESTRGGTVLKSNDFRLKVGARTLRSTLFRVQDNTGGVQIIGKGFGHGVGMSQWGAYRMAQEGHDYRGILQHYYQGVQITSLTSPSL
ncbi:MAG: SpoIID/LytB domain-containing protein [Deltaproteobacteria bacterium]|nr:SpoIID/LytB domain-containing protein [Deltaproteobacteria bacterium]